MHIVKLKDGSEYSCQACFNWEGFRQLPNGTVYLKKYKPPTHSYQFYTDWELEVKKITDGEVVISLEYIGDNPETKFRDEIMPMEEFINYMNSWHNPPAWCNVFRLKPPV